MDLIIFKAKAANQGETRVWADGKTRKKTGKKWVIVSGKSPKSEKHIEADVWRKGKTYFDYSMATNLGGAVDTVLQDMGIKDYTALVKKIKTGPTDTAHRIYKQVVDKINTMPGAPGEKQATLDMIGRSLITLRNQFSVAPKTALKIKVTSKKGKGYYKYKETAGLPTLKASSVAKAKKKMAGWSVTGKLESKHVNGMLKTGTAKLISGKVDSRKAWVMPKKAEDLNLKYKGNSLLIRVKQSRKVKDRTWTTAKAEIRIPYEFAKAFLQNHIKSVRTRSNFIFRMERSAGYRSFLERTAA
jgi:hypothetical protein